MSSAHSYLLHERRRAGWTPISRWPKSESRVLGLLEAVRAAEVASVGVEMSFEGLSRACLQN